jgi:hypothetical protein
MFDLKRDSLFTPMYGIRYVTSVSDRFEPYSYSGNLKFYSGNPLYIVNVALWAERKNLREEDIEIQLGTLHISGIIEKEIEKKKDLIYELCKSYYRPYFVLDVERMNVIEEEDFTETLPTRGINTLFRFSNIKSEAFFMLVNPTREVADLDFMAWLKAYVYSGLVCLSPLCKPDKIAIQFVQALSHLCATGGNKETIYVSNQNLVLNSPVNDMGDFDIEIPGGKSERFKVLATKSLEQMNSKKEKKK